MQSGATREQARARTRRGSPGATGGDPRDVLVALWPHPRDRDVAHERGWYRVRPGLAVGRLGDLGRFHTLAFYQPDAFGTERRCVRYRATVLGCERVARRDLLPEEPDHPRAGQPYTCFRLGPLEELPRPIESRIGRRLLFIPTTRTRLAAATEINELFQGTPIEDRLFGALRADGVWPEREYFVAVRRPEVRPAVTVSHFLDLALFCRERNLDVECDGDTWHVGPEPARRDRLRDNLLEANGWHILRFNTEEVTRALPEVLTRIRTAVNRYGGIVDDTGAVQRYFPDGRLGPAQKTLDLQG